MTDARDAGEGSAHSETQEGKYIQYFDYTLANSLIDGHGAQPGVGHSNIKGSVTGNGEDFPPSAVSRGK